jgi:hypothetical protein
MYKDLSQISKAKDIYRTLDLLAILSPRSPRHETGQYSQPKQGHNWGEQADFSDADVTQKEKKSSIK